MAFTQADLDGLEKIQASGARSFTFSDGRSVNYANAGELAKQIEYVRRRLKEHSGRTRLLAYFSKGVEN